MSFKNDLPSSTTLRIADEYLREQGKEATYDCKAKPVLSQAATVFAIYLTHIANMEANNEKKQTINAKHIFEALNTIEFNEWFLILFLFYFFIFSKRIYYTVNRQSELQQKLEKYKFETKQKRERWNKNTKERRECMHKNGKSNA